MRSQVGDLLFVAAGNLLFEREAIAAQKRGAAARKAELIVEGYNTMGCDALSVGAYDLSLGIDYLMALRAKARFPLLSANLTDPHGARLFDAYRLQEIHGVRVGIFGLIDPRLKTDKIPDGHKLSVTDPQTAAAEAVAGLQKAGAEFIVLLTNIYGRPLRSLALAGLPIDLIVGSDQRNQISLPVVSQDTFVTHLDRGGRSVGHLTIAPEAGTPATGRGELVRGRRFHHQFAQLRLEIPDHPVVGARVVAYEKEEAERQKNQLAVNREGDAGDCGSAYVGVALCATCHPGRYRTWQATEHSHALATLVERDRQYDDECLPCHALAYECDEGTIQIASVEEFANVQCESCHGPGELHAASGGEQPTVPPRPPQEACLRCHTPERSERDLKAAALVICAEAE